MPALAGGSMGGTWALWYPLEHPERVSRLVLLTGAPLLPGTPAPAPVRIISTPVLGDLLTRILKPNAKIVVRLMSSMGEKDTIVRYPDLTATDQTHPSLIQPDTRHQRIVIDFR